MKIDKTIETPMGKAHFIGEVDEAELDRIIEAGLTMLLMQGLVQTQFANEGVEPDEGPVFNTEGPDHGDTIQ